VIESSYLSIFSKFGEKAVDCLEILSSLLQYLFTDLL